MIFNVSQMPVRSVNSTSNGFETALKMTFKKILSVERHRQDNRYE